MGSKRVRPAQVAAPRAVIHYLRYSIVTVTGGADDGKVGIGHLSTGFNHDPGEPQQNVGLRVGRKTATAVSDFLLAQPGFFPRKL